MFTLLMTGFFGAAVMIGGLAVGNHGGMAVHDRPHVFGDILVMQHTQAVLQCARTNPPNGCPAGAITLPSNALLPNGDPRRNSFRSHHLGNGLVVSWYESTAPERSHNHLGKLMVASMLNNPDRLPTGWIGIQETSGTLRSISKGIVRGASSTTVDLPLPTSQIAGANVPQGAPVLVSKFR